jgi:hypothetical protein
MEKSRQIAIGGWFSGSLSIMTRGWFGGISGGGPTTPKRRKLAKRRIELFEDEFVTLLLIEGEDY